MTKVCVAMSGGVDSSVTAALCASKYGKENVFGLTMKLFCYKQSDQRPVIRDKENKSCCSLDAINDARKVCDDLGIAHYVVNFEKEFEQKVVTNFITEYENGNTPNPCIRCNQFIKFDYLLQKARELGADLLATGHYARILPSCHFDRVKRAEKSRSLGYARDDKLELLKGLDEAKDQSYFLYTLTQDQLARIIFPLGEYKKSEVRELARKYNLKIAEKPESQDICFVPSTVEKFLGERVVARPGNIVDKSGKMLGQHRGLAFYTIGQRKGLGGGFAEIMYLIGLDKAKNEVIVGTEMDLFSNKLSVSNVNWIGEVPKLPFECKAKIRYQADEAFCSVNPGRKPACPSRRPVSARGTQPAPVIPLQKGIQVTDQEDPWRHTRDEIEIVVKFEEPQKAITPGQSIVFYEDDVVLGGGIISL